MKGNFCLPEFPLTRHLNRGESMISIRLERPEDVSQVRIINEQAFEQATEANIVDHNWNEEDMSHYAVTILGH